MVKVVKAKKTNLQGKARVTRAREKLVLIFFIRRAKKIER